MENECFAVLDSLRLPHGLYLASPSPAYRYVWIRDSVYMSLPYLNREDGIYEKTFHRLLDLFREYEWKLDIHCKQKPRWVWEYLHARYSADDVKEIHDKEWGHAQHDMVGAFLYGVGAGMNAGKVILRDAKDYEIIGKLVTYLETLEYWQDPDNGMWEESREVHASSVGACVAGLRAVKGLTEVPDRLIYLGIQTLQNLYPRESDSKEADLAQLSLIYPYQLFGGVKGRAIVSRIEQRLLRRRGVVRYEGDSYYSTKEAQYGREKPREFYRGTEAEWTFGLPWLSLCHTVLGNPGKARRYLLQTEQTAPGPGCLPEAFYAGTDRPNPNTPLGWSCAMYLLAKRAFITSKYGNSDINMAY